MQAIRYKGIYTHGFSTSFGSDLIKLFGVNDRVNVDGYIKVNENFISYTNDMDGLAVNVFDSDLTKIFDNFYSVKTNSEANTFISDVDQYMNSNDDYIICLITVGIIERDDNSLLNNYFNNTLYSFLWSIREEYRDISFSGEIVRDRIPYCCLISNKLGIVYENIGKWNAKEESDNAYLEVPYNVFDTLGSNGYGEELSPVNELENNDTGNVFNNKYPLQAIDVSQFGRIRITARVPNLESSPTDSIVINVLENGSIIKTYEFQSNIWQFIDDTVSMNSSNSYELEISKPLSLNFHISSLSIKKAGLNTINNDTVQFKINKKDYNISANGLNETHNNVILNDENSYINAYNEGVSPFTLDTQTFLYSGLHNSLSLSNTIISDIIEVDPNIDLIFSSWIKVNSDNSPVTVTIEFLDENQDPVNIEYFDNDAIIKIADTLQLSSYDVSTNDLGYIEEYILSKNADKFDLNRIRKIEYETLINGDYGLNIDGIYNRPVPRFNSNVKFITISINCDDIEMILPFISEMKFGIGNDGMVMAPLIEDSLI